MANKKRKGGNKKPTSAPQKKSAPQGGGQKKPQQSPKKEAGRAADHPENKTSASPRAGAGQAKSGQAKSGPGRSGQVKPGQKKPAGSARRAAQRRAARRKRQMLTIGGPTVVVVLLVILLIAINGGPQGKGMVASAGDIKVSGAPRTTLVPDGQKLPTFSAPGLSGGTVSSASGQPSVVAIWASWCPVCQQELPILNNVKDGYPGVKTISITTSQGQENGPTAEQFIAQKKITIPVAVDDAGTDLRLAMGVTSFPVLYFVNADGTVYKSNLGVLDEGTMNTYFQTLQQQADQGPGAPTPTPTPKATSKPKPGK